MADQIRPSINRSIAPATWFLWVLTLATTISGLLLYRLFHEEGVFYGEPRGPIADTGVHQLGVNTRLELETKEGVVRSLDLAREAGFQWIRQEFLWNDLERRKGQYHHEKTGQDTWQKYDHIVETALRRGIRIIARLDRPPEWARPPGSTGTHPPLNFLDFGDFVYDFVTHYQDKITHIQLWNEPNLNHEWGGRPVDPAAYVEMLRIGYRRAKEADPHIRVLAAGLAPTLERGDQGLDDLVFLERMYEHGGKSFFDIASVMAYGLWTDADDHHIAGERTNFPRLVLTRRIMDAWGDISKPIWISEFGWNSLPPDWQGKPSPWGSFSKAEQIRSTVRALERARVEWPYVGVMALWMLRYPGAHPMDPTDSFSLIDDTWQPRPLYYSLKKAARGSVLGPGWHEEYHPAFEIEGTGQFTSDPGASDQKYWESPIAGTTVRIAFRGTDLVLLTPVGPGRGVAEVIIDGIPSLANQLPSGPASRAILDQYREEPSAQTRIPIASGLSDRLHVLELTVTGRQHPNSGGPAIAIDAVLVGRSRPSGPYLVTAGILATALGLLLWQLRRWFRTILAPIICPILGKPGTLVDTQCFSGLQPDSLAPAPKEAEHEIAISNASNANLSRRNTWERRPPRGDHILTTISRWWKCTDAGPLAVGLLTLVAAVVLPGGQALTLTLMLSVLVIWRPRTGIYLLILSLPRYNHVVQLAVDQVTLTELLWITTTVGTLARATWHERWPTFPRTFGRPALLLIVGAAVATVGAQVPTVALRELRVVVVEPALLLVLIVTLFRQPGDPLKLISVLVAAGMSAALVSLGLGAAGQQLIEAEGVLRLAGTHSSPNHLALFLGRLLPLALVLIFVSPLKWRTLALLSAVGIGTALLFSFSRGGLLASATGVGVVFLGLIKSGRTLSGKPLKQMIGEFIDRPWLIMLTVFMVLIFFLLAGLATRVERLGSVVDPLGGTMALRLQLWQTGLRMGLDHPFLGVGPDGFLYASPGYSETESWREPFISHPHNLILDYWLRTGIMGIVALGWLLTSWVRATRAIMKKHTIKLVSNSHSRLLALGLAGSITNFVVHGLVDNSYFLPDLAYIFWASAGLLIVLLRTSSAFPVRASATSN